MVMLPSDAAGLDLANINEVLARHLASNDKVFFVIEIWVKLFPIILSSLVAAYSVITASIFYDLNLVANVSIYLFISSILISTGSIAFMLGLNSIIMVELRISKRITKHDKLLDEYTVQYLYKPIYDQSIDSIPNLV